MFTSRLLTALGFSAAALIGSAQASFIANFHPNNSLGANPSLFIFGAEGTSGTVTNNDGFSQNFLIDASGVFNLDLDASAFMSTSDAVNGRSFFTM